MDGIILSSLNLCALLGFLGYKLKDPIRDYVSQRHRTIKDDLADVETRVAEAKKAFESSSAKLDSVQSEVAALRKQLSHDLEKGQKTILAEADQLARTIVADSKRVSDGLFEQLKREVHLELVGKVIDQTEEILKGKLTGDDQLRIRKEFSQDVETLQ